MNHQEDEYWERVRCPLCEGGDSEPISAATPNDLRIRGQFLAVRCRSCGLVYANPRLNQHAMTVAYQSLDEKGLGEPSPIRNRSGVLTRWWRHATQRQVVGDWIDQGPVLDVGCHTGNLLVELRERGFEVRGIEMSAHGVQACRERGLEVSQGLVENLSLPCEGFGTILLSHVLEHVREPLATLRKLRAALIPGGRIVIAVPNSGGVVARLFGPYWHGWDPPFHLTHFEPRTLAAIIIKAGFQLDCVRTRGLPEDVTRSLAKMTKRPARALWARAVLLPPSWLIGKVSLGGEICAVGQRPVSG